MIITVGDLVTDVLAVLRGPLAPGSDTPATVHVSGGGQAANTAAWIAWLGRPVTFVGAVGDDQAGRDRLTELHEAGVRTVVSVRPGASTGSIVVLVHQGERTMISDRGANLLLAPSDVDNAIAAGATHLHLSGYTLLDQASRPAGRAALASAKASGLRTSVDAASAAPLAALHARLTSHPSSPAHPTHRAGSARPAGFSPPTDPIHPDDASTHLTPPEYASTHRPRTEYASTHRPRTEDAETAHPQPIDAATHRSHRWLEPGPATARRPGLGYGGPEEPEADFLAWVHGVDLLIANADEAQALVGPGDPGAQAMRLAGAVGGAAVVKLGPCGALWAGQEGVIHMPIEPAHVVDATGAGDAFAAGLIAALDAGADIPTALLEGCRLGAVAVGQVGARPPHR